MRGRAAPRGFGVLGALVVGLLPLAGTAATATPNDPLFVQGKQWGLTSATAGIRIASAWPGASGSGALVADVDTGADFGNPDLAGKLVAGAAFLNADGSQSGTGQGAVQDDNCVQSTTVEYGHGSMTTGVMVANTNNGQIMAGVAPDATALVVKVLDKSGSGTDAGVANGIVYAANHGAKVINLSIGPEVPLSGNQTAVAAAISQVAGKALVAIAAGNTPVPLADYPGADQSALVVGALGPQGERAAYSNLSGINIYAPGGNDPTLGSIPSDQIYSTDIKGCGDNNGYNYAQGTSLAAPFVAGVAALLVGAPCNMSPDAARNQILATARTTASGLPEVDAGRAVAGCHAASPPRGGGATPVSGGHSPSATGGTGAGATAGSGSGATPGQAAASTSPSASGSPGADALNPGASPTPRTGANPPLQIVAGGGLNPAFLLAAGGFAALAGAATFLWLRQTGRL